MMSVVTLIAEALPGADLSHLDGGGVLRDSASGRH